jgi:tripartite-type tricarboxylate transporter receptor subunit TctC
MRRSLALAVVTALAAIAGIAGAGGAAETYPSRTITMSVPYAPGGPLDTLARILAERLRPVLGQTVIIENVGGAGGSIGVGRVVRSAPDGYTIGAGNWGSHVANVAIYQLPYDVLKDLDPVTLLPVEPNVIVARKALPPNNLKELIAWLKQNPDAATAGTSGVGGPSHMSAIFFEQQTGTRIRLVPYRGSGPALQDLVAGQTDLMITAPSIVLPHVTSGAIKAYAVTAKTRLTVMPDIPTTDEAGLAGFYFSVWTALWVPKGTPSEIVARLAGAVRDVLADPVLKSRLAALGIEIPPPDMLGPEPLRALHKADTETWVPILKAAGIKGE